MFLCFVTGEYYTMLISWSIGTTLIFALIFLPSSLTIPLPQQYQDERSQDTYQQYDQSQPSNTGLDQHTREQLQWLQTQYIKVINIHILKFISLKK